MSSRLLSDLTPQLLLKASRFISRAELAGIHILVYCTKREKEEQFILWKKGRSLIGNKWFIVNPFAIVTHAMTGESFHEYGCAFDFVPLRNGRPVWNNKNYEDKLLWMSCIVIAEQEGITCGARWKGARCDFPHCQWSDGLTINDLKNGKLPRTEGVL